MDILVLQHWLNLMAQAHLSRLEFTCPDLRLRVVRRGETVALLAIDTLYLPVVADREGIIGERLLEPGAQVDFGRALFTFVPQT